MAVSLLCSWVDEQQYSEEHNASTLRVEEEGGRRCMNSNKNYTNNAVVHPHRLATEHVKM
jgi:hypothetical protein